MRRWTEAEEAYLRETFPHERAEFIAHELAERFGHEESIGAVYQKARKMGLSKEPRSCPERAVRKVRWCCEPEMDAWMRENDRGQSLSSLSAAFEREFGFPLGRAQICLWRSSNGRQQRRSHGGGRKPSPVGTERDTGKGYVLVKVREHANVPQSKDNWRMKHVLVWEREHGPLPEGMDVWFADRDTTNYDPANLVEVPMRMRARLNSPDCPEWHDAESLRTAIAWCELHSAIVSAEKRVKRICAVCGREYTNEGAVAEVRTRQTCPDCLKAGRKSKGTRTVKGTRTCAVCGREFGFTAKTQTRCPECIAAHPSWSARQQRKRTGQGD